MIDAWFVACTLTGSGILSPSSWAGPAPRVPLPAAGAATLSAAFFLSVCASAALTVAGTLDLLTVGLPVGFGFGLEASDFSSSASSRAASCLRARSARRFSSFELSLDFAPSFHVSASFFSAATFCWDALTCRTGSTVGMSTKVRWSALRFHPMPLRRRSTLRHTKHGAHLLVLLLDSLAALVWQTVNRATKPRVS